MLEHSMPRHLATINDTDPNEMAWSLGVTFARLCVAGFIIMKSLSLINNLDHTAFLIDAYRMTSHSGSTLVASVVALGELSLGLMLLFGGFIKTTGRIIATAIVVFLGISIITSARGINIPDNNILRFGEYLMMLDLVILVSQYKLKHHVGADMWR